MFYWEIRGPAQFFQPPPNIVPFHLDFSPLRNSRDFRLLYLGQTVSTFGSAITYVVLPWQMYQITKSPAAVGLLGVAEFLPMFLLAFLGGALADAMDRRRLILFSESGLAICCGILGWNAASDEPRAWLLYALAALMAALSAIHRSAIEALTPHYVPLEQMPAVGALHGLRYSSGHILGPSLAGVLVAGLGPVTAYMIDMLTYVAAVVTLVRIRSVPVPPDAEQPSFARIVEGLRYARSRQELLGTYLIDINAMFFGMPNALFPAIAERFGPGTVGLLYAAPAAGTLILTLLSGWTARVHRHGLAVTVAAVVWGIGIVGFGLADQLWLALVCLAVAGAADTVSGIFRSTIWNQTIPDHIRGRMAGIEMVSYLTGPYLGNAEAGLAAAWLGVRTSVVSGGVLCVLGCGVIAALLPKFIQYDGREGLARRRAAEDAGPGGTG